MDENNSAASSCAQPVVNLSKLKASNIFEVVGRDGYAESVRVASIQGIPVHTPMHGAGSLRAVSNTEENDAHEILPIFCVPSGPNAPCAVPRQRVSGST